MATIEASVEHRLGAEEAQRRITAAADKLRAENSKLVRSLVWTGTTATITGDGFSGTLVVSAADVRVNAKLGMPLSFFPLKARREIESWLSTQLA